jgi:hypothetical protein
MLEMSRAAAALAAVVAATGAQADEGLWTYDDFPAARVQQAYGFTPDQAWLDHLRLASVHINDCSAAIVSQDGLVQTNHHCVTECIDSLSAPGQDLNMTPVVAPTLADERTCPGQKAEILALLGNVTERVLAAAKASPAGPDAARQQEIARIEGECGKPGENRRCEVIPLFSGAKYLLHTYRTYSDVRLVLGPEMAAGSFGGDPDNFNFPRYAFDVAYLRLYENGAPAATPNRLKWRSEPLEEGELVFISGHPADTGRSTPMPVVDYYLDTYYPWTLVSYAELRGRLIAYAAQGAEQARVTSALLAEVENTYKANWAERAALQGQGILERLRRAELQLRQAIAADPSLATAAGDAWERIEAAQKVNREVFYARVYLGEEAETNSDLFNYARTILRAADERDKPEEQRLSGYSDAELPSLLEYLSADDPVRNEKEGLGLAFWLAKMREFMTADHPVVRKVLGKESPEGMATRLVSTTRLGDPAERKRLFVGGKPAVDASDDPMLALVRSIDAEGREADRRRRDEVKNVVDAAVRKIAPIRFSLSSGAVYPDATSTLRLTYGRVEGWTQPDGRAVAPFTRFSGLLDRATGADPYRLALAWDAAKDGLLPDTILNVSTTNDTIGGNSGSPAVDRDGALVGAMFDGNIHSLGGYYIFDPALNRTVIIASTAIEEALVKVYGLQRIVDELKR